MAGCITPATGMVEFEDGLKSESQSEARNRIDLRYSADLLKVSPQQVCTVHEINSIIIPVQWCRERVKQGRIDSKLTRFFPISGIHLQLL